MTSTHLAHLELLRAFLVTVQDSLQRDETEKALQRLDTAIDLLDRAITRQNEILGIIVKKNS